MTAIVLAAGRGSRLESHTDDRPKSLLPLNREKTLLDHNLTLLGELGVDDIKIVTGYLAQTIEDHVRDNQAVECVYNPFWDCCNVLGSLYIALPYLQEPFAFLHADTLVGDAVWRDMLGMNSQIVLPYQKKGCGTEEMKVAHDGDGKLRRISKQLASDEADGEFLGIAKFGSGMISFIKRSAEHLFQSDGLQHYMEAVVQLAVEAGIEIQTFDIGDEPFVEVDFEKDYHQARQLFG